MKTALFTRSCIALLASTLFVFALNAPASEKKFFVKGKEVTAGEATLMSLRGESEVYKCSQVEAKASKKTGNISLKTKDSD